MATVSVFNLDAGTALASGDVLPFVDISDNTQSANGSLLKITVANFFGTIPSPVLSRATSPAVANPTGTIGQFLGANSASTIVLVDSYASNSSLRLRRGNTTATTPSAIANGNTLATVLFQGYDGVSAFASGANIQVSATEAWDATHAGTSMVIQTVLTGVAALSSRLSFAGSGLATLSHGLTLTTGDITITAGDLFFSGTSRKIVPSATKITVRNNSDTQNNLTILNDGTQVVGTMADTNHGEFNICITDTTSLPSGNPTGGGFLFSASGILKWLSSGGITSNLAQQVISAMANSNSVPASTTHYMCPAGATSATENIRQYVVPVAKTFSRFFFATTTAQPADGALVLTVRKNGVDTALTATVAANAGAGTFSDTTHSVTFAAGDLLSISLANAATGTSAVVSGAALVAG